MTRSTNTAVLAVDAEGRQIVSVHVKKTYAFDARGACSLADEQAPLFLPRQEPVAPWHAETDIVPIKRTTDVIVHAHAYCSGGAPTCLASIAIAGRKIDYRVFGDRRCVYRGPGSLRFSEPEPREGIPICYENAYGGVDEYRTGARAHDPRGVLPVAPGGLSAKHGGAWLRRPRAPRGPRRPAPAQRRAPGATAHAGEPRRGRARISGGGSHSLGAATGSLSRGTRARRSWAEGRAICRRTMARSPRSG